MLDKIYSKCLFWVEQIKENAEKFDTEIVGVLTKICCKCARILVMIENSDNNQAKLSVESPTVEHISLRSLVERSTEIDISLRLQSDKIWSSIQMLSNANRNKTDKETSDYVTAEKIDKIFSIELDPAKDPEQSVRTILHNFRIGETCQNVEHSDKNCVGVLSLSLEEESKDDCQDSKSFIIGEMVISIGKLIT